MSVTCLPGVRPREFTNQSAIDLLHEVIRQIESGEVVGIAISTLRRNGVTKPYWNAPTNMGELLYYGVSQLAFRMMKDSNG